jgi:hypothetical protein
MVALVLLFLMLKYGQVPIVQRVAVADVNLPDLSIHANERVIASVSESNIDVSGRH